VQNNTPIKSTVYTKLKLSGAQTIRQVCVSALCIPKARLICSSPVTPLQ
jgi:hypothetical protein